MISFIVRALPFMGFCCTPDTGAAKTSTAYGTAIGRSWIGTHSDPIVPQPFSRTSALTMIAAALSAIVADAMITANQLRWIHLQFGCLRSSK